MKTHSRTSLAGEPFMYAALAACVLISAFEMQTALAQKDPSDAGATPHAPIRVFILAGDENVPIKPRKCAKSCRAHSTPEAVKLTVKLHPGNNTIEFTSAGGVNLDFFEIEGN